MKTFEDIFNLVFPKLLFIFFILGIIGSLLGIEYLMRDYKKERARKKKIKELKKNKLYRPKNMTKKERIKSMEKIIKQ